MDIVILLIFAVGILIWSFITFKKRYDLYRSGKRIKGKVLEFRKFEEVILETWDYKEKVTIYRPIIEINIKGKKKIYYYNEEINRKIYSNGDEIDIIYNEKIDDIYIDSKIEFFRFPILLMVFSMVFFLFITVIYLFKY